MGVYYSVGEVKVNSRVAIMKHRQEKEGLTDKEFAGLLGVHRDTWAKVKGGVRNPGLQVLDGFDRQFPDERIFDSGSPRPPQTPQNKLWGAFQRILRTLHLSNSHPDREQPTKSKSGQ